MGGERSKLLKMSLSTGTGIMARDDVSLREGDQVDIEIQGIGRLSNPVRQLKSR